MSRRAAFISILVMAVVLGAGAIYFLFDPASSGLFPRCWFQSLTGWKCPGCGTQRAVHALMHGNVAAAVRYNAFLPVALLLTAAAAWVEWRRTTHPRLYLLFNSRWVIGAMLALILTWWLMRNLMGW